LVNSDDNEDLEDDGMDIIDGLSDGNNEEEVKEQKDPLIEGLLNDDRAVGDNNKIVKEMFEIKETT